MSDPDFSDAATFRYVTEEIDGDKAESGTTASPIYKVYQHAPTGEFYQHYERGRCWRKVSDHHQPLSDWQPVRG
jgi:hypothetical protein